ncbi:tryptophan--tRNA ligase [candidate division GN15 bacterium]|nr:tryptophan--tRNA ligase [candidate division GN15 bacterium]
MGRNSSPVSDKPTQPKPATSAEPEKAQSTRKETILSGMQPTGALHIGNLEGALRNWVNLQHDYWMFCCIVDWHALTADWERPAVLKNRIFEMSLDWLASGLDPDKCAMFIQSEVKEHAELHLLFSMLITVPTLIRLPTYQEKKDKLDSYGFLGYPVLQAADICLYNADWVPVGKDQEKHIWLASDLAKRFNTTYKKVFNEPQAKFTTIPLIPGADNRKMSKSYDNHIPLEFTEKQTEKRLKGYFTDPKKLRKGDPGTPEKCPVFLLHKVYSDKSEVAEVRAGCKSGELGCVDCKLGLSKNMNEALAPIRERRIELAKRPDYVWDVLETVAQRARTRAENVMDKVRSAMKMTYRKKKAK